MNSFNRSGIPEEIMAVNQCCVYQQGDNKAPCQINGKFARVNKLETWSPFEDCYEAYLKNIQEYAGVGVLLGKVKEGANLVCIDIDDCLHNGEIIDVKDKNGNVIISKDVIWKIIKTCDSFTEVSPSSKGLHIFGYGEKPFQWSKRNGVEVYDGNRYIRLTGSTFCTYAKMKDISKALKWIGDVL